MSTTTRRTRVARGATLAATAALAVALLPSAGASAEPVPVFGYLQVTPGSDMALFSNDALGSATAQPLTPAGYQVYSYDMAKDGDTWVASMCHGTRSTPQCTSPANNPAFAYDTTYAVVLVHRFDSTHTVARVLATASDTNPVISSDGYTAWWLSRGTVYEFATTNYDTVGFAINGTTSAVSTGQFAPAITETPTRLAISPSGGAAAVLYADTNPAKARVRASTMSVDLPKPAFFQKSYTSAALAPSSNSFTFTDNATLLYDEVNRTNAVIPIAQVTAALPSAAVNTSSAVQVTALKDQYDVRPYGISNWYAWQDSAAPTISSFGTTSDPLLAPSTFTARSDGATTSRYVPTAVTPPVIVAAANTALAHPSLRFASRSVLTGRTVAYSALNLYFQNAIGSVFAPASAAEVDRGTLSWSSVGSATRYSTPTSGAAAFPLGTTYFIGHTPKLYRNTLFQWDYAGDLFTAPGSTGKLLVTVAPIVTVRSTVSGASRTVYGTAARVGGTAMLYKLVGSRYVKLYAAAITAKGAYSFGRRRLAHGTYRVVTVKDASWASGTGQITF